MAYIGVNSEAEFVQIYINNNPAGYVDIDTAIADTANTYRVPALQEVTVNATPGIFRWKQLDSLSENAVTTSSTNSINLTAVLDDTTFFDAQGASQGILETVTGKLLTTFRLYWAGENSGDRYIQGTAYIGGLAPTVSPDSPVWTSPLTLEIVGDFETGTVA